jgi:two-component system LytT family sensor kinase
LNILRTGETHALPVHPLVFLSGTTSVGGLFALQEWMGYRRMDLHIGLPLLLRAWAVEYLLWGLICWLTWQAMGQQLLRAGVKGMLLGVLPLSFALSVVEEMIWVLCFPHLPISKSPMSYWERLSFEVNSDVIDGVIIFWCVFLLFRGIDYYLRYREKDAKAARLESQLAQAQLLALRMHLNPHFLFNTLNSISSLMQTDVTGADQMLEQFSSLLRITLERGEVQRIPLCEEMEFVEMYMAMQGRRFAGRIQQQIRIDPELHDALVPAMILQPVVENAYAHGLSRLEGQGELVIAAVRDDLRLKISVINSGVGLEPRWTDASDHQGLGLKNVTNRLELHYRHDHSFTIRDAGRGQVEVILSMPLEFCSQPNNPQLAYGA